MHFWSFGLCRGNRAFALGLALRALKLQHNLLRRLSFLVEDRLRLTAKASLLLVVTLCWNFKEQHDYPARRNQYIHNT